jgi:hypothetical protein
MRLFVGLSRSSRTHGAFSPIVIAPGNTGTIITNALVGWRPISGAPQAFRPQADPDHPYYERNPLVEDFRRFLKRYDRGYFAVEAEPGMGKSVFAAWVTAQEHGCAAHSVQQGGGADMTSTVVPNLGKQLIRTWKLDDLAPGGLLPGDSSEPAWLARVIGTAAAHRDKHRSKERIVIVVDALEAAHDYPERALPFGLPEQLPRGVFVVVTARAGQLRNLPPTQVHHVRLRPDQPENRMALDGFLRTKISDDEWIAHALRESGVTGTRFADDLLTHSAGSWLYVRYVLESIKRDPGVIRDIPGLPRGLDAYYDKHILPLCRASSVQGERIALLAALGAAGEPLSAGSLCSLAGLNEPTLVEKLMTDGLDVFCDIVVAQDDPSGLPRYAPHHTSLREYLSGSTSETATDADAILRERIGRACRSAHARICDRYLESWGGLGSGLGSLMSQPELADADGGYALRNLVFHLIEAGRSVDAHQLLALGRGRTNLWYRAHERTQQVGSYLRDVELARTAVPEVTTQLRYRLIEGSIARDSSALPPALANELVYRGIWTPEQAFHRVERIASPDRQARALLPLVVRLPSQLLTRALAIASAFGDADRRQVLMAIATLPDLNSEQRAKVVELAAGRDYGPLLIGPLMALTRYLPGPDAQKLLFSCQLRQSLDREYVRIATEFVAAPDQIAVTRKALRHIMRLSGPAALKDEMVAAMLPQMPEDAFDEMFAYLDELEPEYYEVLMTALGTYTPVSRVQDLFGALAKRPHQRDRPAGSYQELMIAACQTGTDWSARTALPRALASRINIQDALNVLALASAFRGFAVDSETVRMLARRISTPAARRLLDALNAPGSSRDLYTRHVLLGALLEHLPAAEARAAAEAEIAKTEFHWRHASLAYLAQHLAPNTRRPLLDELCKNLSYGLPGYGESKLALANLAPHLCLEELSTALDAVSGNSAWNADARFEAIDALAPHLPETLLTQLARDTASRGLDSECFAALSELGKLQSPQQATRTARRGLALAQGIKHHESLAAAVREIAPILPPDEAEGALGLLEPITNPDWKVPAIDALSPRLADEQLPRALSIALYGAGFMDAWVISRLPRLLSRLAAAGHSDKLGEVLDAQLKCFYWPDTMQAFIALLPILTPDQVQHAWDSMVAQEESPGRAEALAAVVRHLPHAARADATQLALAALDDSGSDDPWDTIMKARARALGHLLRAGTDPPDPVVQALRTYLRDASAHSFPLYLLIEEFHAMLPPAVAGDALKCALAQSREDLMFRALAAIAPSLNPDQALRAAKAIAKNAPFPDVHSTAALTSLAARLGTDKQDTILNTAWEHARAARDLLVFRPYGPVDLFALATMVPPSDRQIAVRMVVSHHSPAHASWKPGDLPAALPFLTADELEELYAAVTKAENAASRAAAQAHILRHLGIDWHRAAFLAKPDLHRTWASNLDRAALANLLAASAWWLHREGGASAVDEVVDAMCDVCTWWP